MSRHRAAAVAEHFRNPTQQHEAAQLGMWLFLASELMLFGAVFLGITVYRIAYPRVAAEASHHLHALLAGANTAVLLTSSLTMALAVLAGRSGARRRVVGWCLLTAALGLAFLAIKGYEYRSEYGEGLMPGVGPPFPLDDRRAELFFNVYFTATGLHALHLSLGIVAVCGLAWFVGRRHLRAPTLRTRVDSVGLYWHFVDVVWVFLYPALYLVK